jgi:hypothetical protein
VGWLNNSLGFVILGVELLFAVIFMFVKKWMNAYRDTGAIGLPAWVADRNYDLQDFCIGGGVIALILILIACVVYRAPLVSQ